MKSIEAPTADTGPAISEDLKEFLSDAPWYASADSVPEAYAVSRPAWLVFAFLLVYTATVVLLLQRSGTVERAYSWFVSIVAEKEVVLGYLPMRLRLMFIAMLATFPFFLAGPVFRRLMVALGSVTTFLAVALIVDSMTVAFGAPGRMVTLLIAGNVLVGFSAMAIFGVALLVSCRLPPSEIVHTILIRRWSGMGAFALALAASVPLVILATLFGRATLDQMRSLGLIGGLGPGVVLFMPVFTGALAVVGLRRARAVALSVTGEPARPIAILVPAYNEERGIGDCIRHLDIAASRYAGTATLYLIDNNSRDDTAKVALRAMADCDHLRGNVMSCVHPGKSKALNYGLAKITEDVVIRVDADTLVTPNTFRDCIRHFHDPLVGAVGGIPLPVSEDSLLGRLRAIEVYLTHGYARLGWAAVEGLLSIPGIFSAYRRDCLIELGGFAEGMNGEDSDIVIRIGRLGYRVVNDPTIEVYSETPESYPHLREQRLRWFRSTFHVAARNRSAVHMLQGVRGVWSLPWAIVQASRRAMILPIVLFAILVAMLEPGALHLRSGAAIVAVLVGSPFLVSVIVLLAYKRYRLLADLPSYIGFRMLRAFFTLETLLTLPLRRPLTVPDAGPRPA